MEFQGKPCMLWPWRQIVHVTSDLYSLHAMALETRLCLKCLHRSNRMDIWMGSLLIPWRFGSLTESLGMHDRQPEQRTRNIHLILPEN